MANSLDTDQTDPIEAVCSGSTLFATIFNLSVMLGNYLQQTTSADDIFRCITFLGALRVKFGTHLVYGSISRPLDKNMYLDIIYFISQPKHMLWVLKRTVSRRLFF